MGNYVSGIFCVSDTSLVNVSIAVCESDDINCQLCGINDKDWQKVWITVFCPSEGLEGTVVTIRQRRGQYLEVCGVKIYGSQQEQDNSEL